MSIAMYSSIDACIVPHQWKHRGICKARGKTLTQRTQRKIPCPEQDLLTRMMSFVEDREEEEEEENGGMCILSANGVISNVALTSGGAMVTYEVTSSHPFAFDILLHCP